MLGVSNKCGAVQSSGKDYVFVLLESTLLRVASFVSTVVLGEDGAYFVCREVSRCDTNET